MAEHYNHNIRTMYECVDKDSVSATGLSAESSTGAFFSPVEPNCNSLSCPPYSAGREFACALCTR